MAALILLLSFLVSFFSHGEVASGLSPQGIQRLKENVAVLDSNISDTKKNLQTAKSNLSTIENDLKELDSLQRQYSELRKKHLDYKTGIQKEWAKNESSLKELKQFEMAGRTPNSTLKLDPSDVERASKEKQERESWKESASQKLARVEELLKGVDESLLQIQTQRRTLTKQKSHWRARATSHEKLLGDLDKKKVETERRLGEIEKGRPLGQPSSKQTSG